MKFTACFAVLVPLATGHVHHSHRHLAEPALESREAMDAEVVEEHRAKLHEHHEEFTSRLRRRPRAAELEANASNASSALSALFSTEAALFGSFLAEGAESDKQMPVASKISQGELKKFLDQLSASCQEQFQHMLQGQGKARDLHRFGTSQDFNASLATCGRLGGALCANHARVKQRSKAPDGRVLVSSSDVGGESCLPRKCIQDPDLGRLAQLLQQKAVESLGAAASGQRPAEVLLDVDCTKSGGATYSSTSHWSMQTAGPGRSGARQGAGLFGALALVCLQVLQ
ncbi:unnamed protein product [Effrenium voratum]|uniref:Uncharacterized protein n=1 Tax=Effrenium voratum TaxID=2562239 RepID=A0AA36IST7_9DINO|nr:unnamed protein product [Effrenium voratum]CAJ1450804.1 unnamed protein product [Effrenium voratum]